METSLSNKKIVFNIYDDLFAHDKYAVAGRESENIVWDRSISNKNNPTFYSHNRILEIESVPKLQGEHYGLMFESRSIIPYVYHQAEKYINKFNKFFTHNSEFLNKYDNCFWIPGGGIWIGGTYGGGEIKVHKKTKLCSFVSSPKRMCELHDFRLFLFKSLIRNEKVDLFGMNIWRPIYESLHDYMFSIVIENFVDDLYFTEKILNCFATGTIPIYMGARNINLKFNGKSILTFKNTDELNNLLAERINEDFYNESKDSILDNFERAQKYKSIEDYIYTNYLK